MRESSTVSTLLDTSRKAVEGSSNTPCRIAKESGVHRRRLSPLLSGERGLSMEAAEQLLACFGLEVVVHAPRKKKRTGTHKRSLPYEELQTLVKLCGGTMHHRPVGRGVIRTIELRGESVEVPVPDGSINALDECYEPPAGNPHPTHQSDWDGEKEFRLRLDAQSRIVALLMGG